MKEFAEIKSQLGKKISIYMLSSSTGRWDINRVKNIYEVAGYISKPVDVCRLTGIFYSISNNIYNI
jgi:hypothetical protein